MPDKSYLIIGSEYSPFSVKVRSYVRYKNIPHEWRQRTLGNMAEFQKYAKLPLIPLVVGPGEEVLQDSTPIIETLETRFPDPALEPPSAALAFLSALIEDYADEWVNKPMFHYRWWGEEDQIAVAGRLAANMAPGADEAKVAELAAGLRARMVPRLRFVGSSEQTKPVIEASLDNLLGILEAHLETRDYLFGGRPCLADFGLFGQVNGCLQQPTTERMIRAGNPRTLAWLERMQDPKARGDFETWATLAPTLSPLLKSEIGELYLPWSLANEAAVARGEEEFTARLAGQDFTQQISKYAAKSLKVLRDKRAAIRDPAELDAILAENACLQPLVSAA